MPCESIPVVRQRITDIVVGDRLTAIVGQQLVFPCAVIRINNRVRRRSEFFRCVGILFFIENVTTVVIVVCDGLVKLLIILSDKAVELVCP